MFNFLRKKIEARLFGGDVKRMIAKSKIPDQYMSMKRLKHLGFTPQLIFDIGAYEGNFTQMCLELWPDCKIIAFEALPEKIGMLKTKFNNKNVRIVEGIVGEENRDDVNYFADETSSSVLESQEFTPKKRLKQKMFTLDYFVSRNNLQPPDFLKIDTQGYEYPILKGFENNLGNIKVILLELNFIEVYHQVKLAHEVIQYLNTYGFVVYDICEIHRRPLDMALFQIDYIFVRQDADLRKDKRWDKD